MTLHVTIEDRRPRCYICGSKNHHKNRLQIIKKTPKPKTQQQTRTVTHTTFNTTDKTAVPTDDTTLPTNKQPNQ